MFTAAELRHLWLGGGAVLWLKNNVTRWDALVFGGCFELDDAQFMSEPDQVPVLPKRRWLAIWAAVIMALVVFSVVSPDTTDPIAPQTSVPRTQY